MGMSWFGIQDTGSIAISGPGGLAEQHRQIGLVAFLRKLLKASMIYYLSSLNVSTLVDWWFRDLEEDLYFLTKMFIS